jgi:hypothetical protein
MGDAQPAKITEDLDDDAPRYKVRFGDKEFFIFGLDDWQGQGWGRAAHAFFTIVNDQLANSKCRFLRSTVSTNWKASFSPRHKLKRRGSRFVGRPTGHICPMTNIPSLANIIKSLKPRGRRAAYTTRAVSG